MRKTVIPAILLIVFFLPFSSAITEYYPNETAQFIISFTDIRGNPVTNANCTATILFPNKTAFINNQPMQVSPSGTYYISFTVPNTLGIYEEIATCNYTYLWIFKRTIKKYGSFKVSSNIAQQISGLEDLINELNQTIEQLQEIVQNNTNITNEIIANISMETPLYTATYLAAFGFGANQPKPYQYCLDNSTLVVVRKLNVCTDVGCKPIETKENITCEYGCDFTRHECIPSPTIRGLQLFGIVFAIFFVGYIVYLWLSGGGFIKGW